jgi:hypothetical protein
MTVCLSKLRTQGGRPAARARATTTSSTMASWVAEGVEDLRTWWFDRRRGGWVERPGLRVVRHASPWADIAAAHDVASALGVRAAVHVRMASTIPPRSSRTTWPTPIACGRGPARCPRGVRRGRGAHGTSSWTPSWDIDRGYFVRNGLIDRRYNPRLASRGGAAPPCRLADAGRVDCQRGAGERMDGARLRVWSDPDRCLRWSCLPGAGRCRVPRRWRGAQRCSRGPGRRIDLGHR